MNRLIKRGLIVALVLAAFVAGVALLTGVGAEQPKEAFDPTTEFALDDHLVGGPIVIGSLGGIDVDLGITKGVAYILISLALCCLFALYVNRRVVRRARTETRAQTMVEGLYEFAHDQIAGAGLGAKTFSRYMPLIAALFMFIWFVNLISFLPLPFNTEHTIGNTGIPSFGIYAVSSNIFFTLTLAIMVFFITQYEGIAKNGIGRYVAGWGEWDTSMGAIPRVALWTFTFALHALSELVVRPISLSVRLFANMLAGHMLILVMLSLAGIIGGATYLVAAIQGAGLAVALAFYLFELVLVASLQAYIFAVLSGLYIGGAAEGAH